MVMVGRLADALEISDEARVITLGSPPYKIVHTNKSWAKLTEYKFAEIAYQTNAFLQGPETEKSNAAQLAQACRSGKHARVRLLNYTKSGQPFFNTIEVFPLRDGDGVLTHFCGVLQGEPARSHKPWKRTDPTDMLESTDLMALLPEVGEEEHGGAGWPSYPLEPPNPMEMPYPLEPQQQPEPLDHGRRQSGKGSSSPGAVVHRPKRQRGERVRLADALNNTDDAVILTEAEPPYRITHVNEPWRIMCGYTQEEVEGQTNAILQGPETDEDLLNDLMSCVGRGESASGTFVNYKKGGERFINQLHVKPVYNEDDELEHFMALLHEVDDM